MIEKNNPDRRGFLGYLMGTAITIPMMSGPLSSKPIADIMAKDEVQEISTPPEDWGYISRTFPRASG